MNRKSGNPFIVSLILIGIFLWSCQKNVEKDDLIVDDSMFESEESTLDDGHSASNSLDFFGVYRGILPCADCEGIETIIELGTENSYTKKITYLGSENQNVIETSGTFTWNEAGNTITLTGEDIPNQYFVGENILFHLDETGSRITGDLAEKYQLKK